MEEKEFEELRKAIDKAVDSDPTGERGIAMGFKLAGEFLKRDLLKTVRFKMLVEWDTKTYRDRYIYPDPMMEDFEYRLGSP